MIAISTTFSIRIKLYFLQIIFSVGKFLVGGYHSISTINKTSNHLTLFLISCRKLYIYQGKPQKPPLQVYSFITASQICSRHIYSILFFKKNFFFLLNLNISMRYSHPAFASSHEMDKIINIKKEKKNYVLDG